MHYRHHEELWQVVKTRPDQWALFGMFPGKTASHEPVYVYKATGRSTVAAQDLSKYVIANLNGSLKNWPVVMKLACDADPSSNQSVVQH
jgi:hypothetical protein